MQRYKFKLETVLRHREIIESLREQDFATANGILQLTIAKIAGLKADFDRTVHERPGSVSGERIDAPAVLDRERYLLTLQTLVEQEQRRAEAARIVVEETRRALVAAKQARETVSRLKDRKQQAHKELYLRLEQNALDELATQRFVRTQGVANETSQQKPQGTEEAA